MGSRSNPGEDRISALPDEILYHILSFTPTADAVKTSVLSHRWKNMWLSVPALNLSERDFESDEEDDSESDEADDNESDEGDDSEIDDVYDFGSNEFPLLSERFVAFVDRVLFLRGASKIPRIRIRCKTNPVHYPHVDRWIRTAIEFDVVELDLALYATDDDREEDFWFPSSFFLSRSLVVLKLALEETYITIPPTSDCFPALKFLHVVLMFPHDKSMENLFTRCPVLEDLILEGFLGERRELNFNIVAPNLKRLKLGFDPFIYADKVSAISFNINAPKLEGFDLNENFVASFSLSENDLNEASISFWDLHSANIPNIDSVYGIQRLFEGIVNVKHLSLQAPFFGDPIIESFFDLPTLNNLKHLELELEHCCSWQFLTRFLTISPNLEHLALEINVECCEILKPKEDVCFLGPEIVPMCLVSSLKDLVIRGFEGKSDNMEVAKYLLKHGEVLNNVTIYASDDIPEEDMLKVCQEVSMSPKGSKTCQVNFPETDF